MLELLVGVAPCDVLARVVWYLPLDWELWPDSLRHGDFLCDCGDLSAWEHGPVRDWIDGSWTKEFPEGVLCRSGFLIRGPPFFLGLSLSATDNGRDLLI